MSRTSCDTTQIDGGRGIGYSWLRCNTIERQSREKKGRERRGTHPYNNEMVLVEAIALLELQVQHIHISVPVITI